MKLKLSDLKKLIREAAQEKWGPTHPEWNDHFDNDLEAGTAEKQLSFDDIIAKLRNGEELTEEEIDHLDMLAP